MKFRIKEARELRGLSQKELAKILNIKPTTFNGYEKGSHDPKSNVLAAIAKECGVTTDYLLGLSENPSAFGVDKQNEKMPDEAEMMSDLISCFLRIERPEDRQALLRVAACMSRGANGEHRRLTLRENEALFPVVLARLMEKDSQDSQSNSPGAAEL